MTLQVWAILSIIAAIVLALIFRVRCRAAVVDPPATRMVHLIFIAALVLMALSSIFLLAIGLRMRGWMLIGHMAIAPLFSLAIAALALLWAQRTSVCIRLILVSGFLTIVTAMFMMMTWFGTDWQRCLLIAHRISSMVLLVAAGAQAGKTLLAGNADAARARD
jgi:hypothetical protein